MTRRIITKRFFERSPLDQAQTIDAAVAALEEVIRRSFDKRGRQRAKRMLRRLERKAVEYGVCADDREATDEQGDVDPSLHGHGGEGRSERERQNWKQKGESYGG